MSAAKRKTPEKRTRTAASSAKEPDAGTYGAPSSSEPRPSGSGPLANARGSEARGKPSSLVDTRVIYCGDNLEQLKKLPDACVDLIYIDPPFNSNRNYEVFWGETKEKRAFDDRHASTDEYIRFMRPRCVELHRVLKKTGSFYFHCDWHASHYVKVMLDGILGENNFQNEIVWLRSLPHGNQTKKYGSSHDVIFFYTGGDEYTWNPPFQPHREEYLETFYKFREPDGRVYRLISCINPNPNRPNLTYEWNGVTKVWKYTRERMKRMHDEGLLVYSKTGTPSYKGYLENMKGTPLQDTWTDIPPLMGSAAERLGYPTQKPLALLERIIKASSSENDIVLDAFCGCGTALVAAQNLRRQWIGIDISPTACRVMAKRLEMHTTLVEQDSLWKIGRGFKVKNLPWTAEKLREIPPFEFENWAVNELGGVANRVKVGDMGIDGRIYPVSMIPSAKRQSSSMFDNEVQWYPIQVKQKDKAGRPDIDAFETAMRRADRTLGYFVSFDFSKDAHDEIDRFERLEGRRIKAYTVQALLDMDTSTEGRRMSV
jgi:DNA modification methylase